MKSKSTQAWGWLTAGVLALGLNGVYQDGGAAWAHRAVNRAVRCIAERTGPVLALASGDADAFLAGTKAIATNEIVPSHLGPMVARLESGASGMQSGYTRIQAASARQEAKFARQEAQMARLEANRARIEARIESRMASLRIPDVKVDVNVPAICPRVRVNVPRATVMRCSW
jgi:hypothetical protein